MYEDQINIGVAWLNEDRPGWLDKVDLDSLNMGDTDRCVAGQTGGYTSNYLLESKGLPPDFNETHGFNKRWCSDPGMYDLDKGDVCAHDTLSREWKAKILKLRAV